MERGGELESQGSRRGPKQPKSRSRGCVRAWEGLVESQGERAYERDRVPFPPRKRGSIFQQAQLPQSMKM